VEDSERDVRHAAAVLHFYARQIERGWRHRAVEHDFCVGAAGRLLRFEPASLTALDRRLLLRVADLLECAEPTAFAVTVRGLRRLAAQIDA